MRPLNAFFSRISLRLRLFLPLLVGIILAIALVTVILTRVSIKAMNQELEQSLGLEVKTIIKMFERERDLKVDQVKTHMRVAHDLFYREKFRISGQQVEWEIMNQITRMKHSVSLARWYLGEEELHSNTDWVDRGQSLFGGTVTIFQLADSGFVRISTNVLQTDSSRALRTFIPRDSPVSRTILMEKSYYGRAFVVNDWYITAYEPIYYGSRIVGMLYVGNKEKDLEQLRDKILELKLGKSGRVFVFDETGDLIMGPEDMGSGVIWDRVDAVNPVIHSTDPGTGQKTITAIQYFPDFRLYVAASIWPAVENRDLIRRNIINAILLAIAVVLILSTYIYFMATNRLHRYLRQVQDSRQKLSSTRKALRESEDRFKTLFNNAMDMILLTDKEGRFLEVNRAASRVLQYTEDQMTGMRIHDITSIRYREHLDAWMADIVADGKGTLESEYLSREKERIPVEMKSRLIYIGEEPYILTVARHIGERKELERRILSAVIQAEEKERERFSSDMHDGLGPLLSTIKLYVNELREDGDGQDRDLFIRQASGLIDEAIENTRTISNNLMPRMIHEYGLVKALESFCSKLNLTGRIRVDITSSMGTFEPARDTQLILFRVLTELINNTIKHSSATRADVHFDIMDNHVLLVRYRDNGEGFSPEEIFDDRRGGMGLKNIASRIKSINGTIDFSGNEQGGVGVKIRIVL